MTFKLVWRINEGSVRGRLSAPIPFGHYFIEAEHEDSYALFLNETRIDYGIPSIHRAQDAAVTDFTTRANEIISFNKEVRKVLEVEKMRGYLDACEWGDVPDKAHALVAYLAMDGYVLPPKNAKIGRHEAQVAVYATFYGQAGLPKEPGFYWAFWLTATPGTVEADELTPALKWDVVEVDHNMMGGDPSHPEYWLVAVAGVERAQFVGNFMWGPRIPNYEPKASDFCLKEGPILDRILGDVK